MMMARGKRTLTMRHIGLAAILIGALALVGCGESPKGGHGASPVEDDPRGDDVVMIGTVTEIDNDGNLQTNIPTEWIQRQGQSMKMTIGTVDYAALFACVGPRNAVGIGGWGLWWRDYDGKWGKDDTFKIYLKGGNAAKAADASVGTRVRLVKVDGPPAYMGNFIVTVTEVDKDGNLMTDLNMFSLRQYWHGNYLNIMIASKDYRARLFFDEIPPDAAKKGEWVAWGPFINPADGTDRSPQIRIDLKGGNASKATGATVGTRFYLDRADEVYTWGTVVNVDTDGNLLTDISPNRPALSGRGEYVRITIARKGYQVLPFVWPHPKSVGRGKWKVWVPKTVVGEDGVVESVDAPQLMVGLEGGSAAKTTGATFGSTVYLYAVVRPTPVDAKSPKGNGGDIVGTITKVDEEGDLDTDIPFQWLAAKRTDKSPADWDKHDPPERLGLKITIGEREYDGTFARNAQWDKDWVVYSSSHGSHRLRIVFIGGGGSAAETTGATVGTKVRFVKIGKPN